MKVKDCYKQVTVEADLVREDTTIEDVIKIMSRNPASRAVFVVKEKKELIGMIGMQQLLNIMGMQYSRENSITLISQVMAKTAADIMIPPKWVLLEDDIQEALKLAVQHDLQDIPVLSKGKVIGNLNCFEILNNMGKSS
jgi:CBS domain-containing protein